MPDFIGVIFYYFRRALPTALAGLAVGAGLAAALAWKDRRQGRRFPKGRAAAILLLACYLGGLAAVTFADRLEGGMRAPVQLYPLLAFREAWNAFTLQTWLNPLLNVAMFLPLGALLPLTGKRARRWVWALAAGAGASLCVEALQYALGRGQADVDDLICNVLGTMLGYCLCMLAVRLAEKRRRAAWGYAALPVLAVMALAGVFLAYRLRPYGNLADGPIYAARTEGVEWTQDCSLSDEPGPSGMYWAEPFTREACDDFAVEFIGRQGGVINFGTPDVAYYDNCAFYSDHTTYNLIVYYNDRSYEYTDYRVDSDLRYGEKGGTVTESALRDDLEALGIEIPAGADFAVLDEEKGRYAFRAECLTEGDTLTDGELICSVAEGGALYQVDNGLSVSVLAGDAAVLSPMEAYQRLRAGRFAWRDVPAFNALKPGQVRVTGCELEYLTDSKGYRQPVYTFTLTDDRSAELRGSDSWTTFVPALG